MIFFGNLFLNFCKLILNYEKNIRKMNRTKNNKSNSIRKLSIKWDRIKVIFIQYQ